VTDEGPTDATAVDPETLLRAWFHWWHSTPGLPTQLPQALHVTTAAYLAARAMEDGRKLYGRPANL
jgi:hypothetical protein